MLKAIWPSLRSRVPNHLPETTNITTLGAFLDPNYFRTSQRPTGTPKRHRNHVLFYLLDYSTAFHARLSAQDSVVIPRESTYRPAFLARSVGLVNYKGTFVKGPFHATCECDRERVFLVVFDRVERGAWDLRDVGCEYSGFYCTVSYFPDILDADSSIFPAICEERKIVRPTVLRIIERGEILTWIFLKAICSICYYPNFLYVLRFRRYRGYQCRDGPLRRASPMEPTQSHR